MTKKKTAKKKTAKKTESRTCSMCEHFRINGKGAKRGRCHRYPSSTPTEINHFCGEWV
jgi:hypothetical protein